MAVLPKNLDTNFRNILTKDFSPDFLHWQACDLKKVMRVRFIMSVKPLQEFSDMSVHFRYLQFFTF